MKYRDTDITDERIFTDKEMGFDDMLFPNRASPVQMADPVADVKFYLTFFVPFAKNFALFAVKK